MSKRTGNIFEQHIEKVILGAAGVVFVLLFIVGVIRSGSYVKYGSDWFGPGRLDARISMRALKLKEKLEAPPMVALSYTGTSDPNSSTLIRSLYTSQVKKFEELLASAISFGDDAVWPMPSAARRVAESGPFAIPRAGEVRDASAAVVGGVVYIPVEGQATAGRYVAADSRLADLDLVTVQGLFDVAGLRERFSSCFSGAEDARHYAKPVFAAVQLQRQKMSRDGSWPGEEGWEVVPRAKNDPLREMIEVPESVGKLPVDRNVEILMIQFNQPQMRIGLTQPEPYEFTVPVERWLPPVFEAKRVKRMEQQQAEEERKRREQAKEEKEREREEKLRSRGGAAQPGGPGSGAVEGGSRGGRVPPAGTTETGRGPGGRGGAPRRAMLPALSERGEGVVPRLRGREVVPEERGVTAGAIGSESRPEEAEYDKIKLGEQTDFDGLEKLVFWAHDDTAEPGSTYQYRIRIGVFNPIAGTDRFVEKDKGFKDSVVLWSGFSEVVGPVEIPGRVYLFPSKVAREADKSVSVQVAKKSLGKWYMEDFIVRPGEVIGGVRDLPQAGAGVTFAGGATSGVQSVDYGTGALLLDVVDVTDWGGSSVLRPRSYPDMLYTLDGTNIEHLPVKEAYWPDGLRKKLKQIKELQDKQAEQASTLPDRGRPGSLPEGRELPGMPGARESRPRR
jgi:hypothetical protein